MSGKDYTDKLHDVFDLCDVEKKGYISVEHFVSLAKEHFGAEEQGEEVCGSLYSDIVLDNYSWITCNPVAIVIKHRKFYYKLSYIAVVKNLDLLTSPPPPLSFIGL